MRRAAIIIGCGLGLSLASVIGGGLFSAVLIGVGLAAESYGFDPLIFLGSAAFAILFSWGAWLGFLGTRDGVE